MYHRLTHTQLAALRVRYRFDYAVFRKTLLAQPVALPAEYPVTYEDDEVIIIGTGMKDEGRLILGNEDRPR